MQPTAGIRGYVRRLGMLSRNAKLYLVAAVFLGLGSGIWVQFFLYLKLPEVGFNSGFIGDIFAVGAIATGFMALPAGLLCERVGPKRAILIGFVANLLNIFQITSLHSGILLGASISSGLIATISSVSVTPLLVESSNTEDRAYLFTFQSALLIAMTVVGSFVGGFLPDLFNQAVGYATGPNGSAFGYRVSLGISISLSMAAFIPVLLMKQTSMRKKRSTVDSLRVWKYKSARTILKFMIPTALIGFGAGFVIPLVNIFFNLRYNASSEEVGAISALGNITLGLGILLTPVLSKKITRVKFIVICQYLSMPFIMLTAFSPNLTWAAGTYIVRTALMNVAGPIGTTFQMESVAPEDRAATNGIMTMTDQIPRALTARISGVMMARGDFFTEFPIMAGTYVISTSLYYAFFRKDETKKPLVTDKE